MASRVLEYTGNLGKERQLTAIQLGGDALDDVDTTSTESIHESTNDTKQSTSKANDTKEEITLLDTLTVERERGITVKASAASMLYRHQYATNPNKWILLNMVDTPGHADFGMEVSKSLDSVEGAVLLFDAAQGVQAQTLSVYDKAKVIGEQRMKVKNISGANDDSAEKRGDGGIKILPALTKVDMPSARPLEVALAVSDLMGFDPGKFCIHIVMLFSSASETYDIFRYDFGDFCSY